MDILETLASRGAVLTDKHFVYKSGKHGPHYINMDPVFPDTKLMDRLCDQLGYPFSLETDVVTAAATGGIPLAMLTAGGMAAYRDPRDDWPQTTWADKVGDDFAFMRAGFAEALHGKNVLVVEDLLNTGDSVKKVIAQVRKHGGNVIGVSVICNRGSETAETLGVPRLEELSGVDFKAFGPDGCPLCGSGEPIVSDIGHGDKFQQHHPDYAGGFVKLLK